MRSLLLAVTFFSLIPQTGIAQTCTETDHLGVLVGDLAPVARRGRYRYNTNTLAAVRKALQADLPNIWIPTSALLDEAIAVNDAEDGACTAAERRAGSSKCYLRKSELEAAVTRLKTRLSTGQVPWRWKASLDNGIALDHLPSEEALELLGYKFPGVDMKALFAQAETKYQLYLDDLGPSTGFPGSPADRISTYLFLSAVEKAPSGSGYAIYVGGDFGWDDYTHTYVGLFVVNGQSFSFSEHWHERL